MPRSQKEKSCISQFGELSVAAELNRRGYLSSVTYGNQKSTDVVVLSDDGRYAIIEVKTSITSRFPTGLTPEKQKIKIPNRFWVFVSTKIKSDNPDTRFFIVSDAEAKAIQAKADSAYNDGYKKKHGIAFKNTGVPNISISALEKHLGAWTKIEDFLNKK